MSNTKDVKRKNYVSPEVKLVLFSPLDIISVSGLNDNLWEISEGVGDEVSW